MDTPNSLNVNANRSVPALVEGDTVSDDGGPVDKTIYFTPVCDIAHKPRVSLKFPSFEAAERFYKEYAGMVGFDTRYSTTRKDRDGKVFAKYIVCHREGSKNAAKPTSAFKPGDGVAQEEKNKRRPSNRVGCKARVMFKDKGRGGVEIQRFEERHTHAMNSEIAKQFLKVNRKMQASHQPFVANCARANIGPVKSYRLYKEMVGGYGNIGATIVDFKNFKRDLQAYILGGDAQLMIEKFFNNQEANTGYFFEYDVDEFGQLTKLFWADPISQKNFSVFGDSVSFDATYRTNRYNLVFIPFTGVDNHKRCVTFGAGLLSKEDVESYVWILERFKKAMGKEPNCTITDQDPSMRIAAPMVFPNTRHRFCMWHIMTKVSEKVGPVLAKDLGFRQRLNRLVWSNDLEPRMFENGWHELMTDYNLKDHKWFQSLFEMKHHWVPAYFTDVFMGGIVRTTSRSEGENNFFGYFTRHHSTLIEFFIHFDSEIEAQRHTQASLDATTEGYQANMRTPLQIERHASSIYTMNKFYDVQMEICAACFDCRVLSVNMEKDTMQYEVTDGTAKVYKVDHKMKYATTTCSCGQFMRVGLLCRHIFVLFKDLKIERIPAEYVVGRCSRDAGRRGIFPANGLTAEHNLSTPTMAMTIKQAWGDFFTCIDMAEGSMENMMKVTSAIKELKDKLEQDVGTSQHRNGKQAIVEGFCGTITNPIPTVFPLAQAKNKGSGKRWKSGKEKAQEQQAKAQRRCKTCMEMGHHDSRNCPLAMGK